MNLSPQRARFLESDFSRGFIAFCGFSALSAGEGRFESELLVRPEHRQQDGFIHAGVMAAMSDHTAGYAAYTLVDETYRVLTIEFKINFLKPASGERLVCRAKVLRRGRSVMVAESAVFDLAEGRERDVTIAIVTLSPVPASSLARARD